MDKLETNITKKHKYSWILGYFSAPLIEPLWFSTIQENRGLENQQIELLNDISICCYRPSIMDPLLSKIISKVG